MSDYLTLLEERFTYYQEVYLALNERDPFLLAECIQDALATIEARQEGSA